MKNDISIVSPHLSICAIVPANNEAECIDAVIKDLLALKNSNGLPLLCEVIVADNASTDDTSLIAKQAGALVIDVPKLGYGQACWDAILHSKSEILLFVDGDGAANPAEAASLINGIYNGADLVIGVRAQLEKNAMTFPQRWGNALACSLIRWIWQIPIQDLGPYRAIRRSTFDALKMCDRSFGWTVEMQIRAHVLGFTVKNKNVQWRARTAGHSKISGTVRGVIGASFGILGMILRIFLQENRRKKNLPISIVKKSSNKYFSKC